MALSVGQIVRAKVYCVLGNQLGINVHHYEVTATEGDSLDLPATASLYSQRVQAGYKPLLATPAEYRGVSLQTIYPGAFSTVYYSGNGNGYGLAGDAPLPSQTSGIIAWKTDLAGRANRGRSYIPFPAEDDNDDDAAPMDQYMTHLDDLVGLVSGTFLLGLAADKVELTHGILNAVGTHARPVTSAVPRQMWATQRRRGAFGAPNTTPI